MNDGNFYILKSKSPSYRPCPINATTYSVDQSDTNTNSSCIYPNSNSISASDTVNCYTDKPNLVNNVISNNILYGVCGS